MGFFSAIGASLGGRLVDEFLPADDPDSGSKLGQHAKDYYDSAFPGTNPWERLGAGNPSGASSVAHQQQKQKNKELHTQAQTQTNIAKIHADAQVKSAQISADPAGRQAALSEAKAPYEIEQLVSNAQYLDAGAKERLASTLLKQTQEVHTAQDVRRVIAQTGLLNEQQMLTATQILESLSKQGLISKQVELTEQQIDKALQDARIRKKDADYYEFSGSAKYLKELIGITIGAFFGRGLLKAGGDNSFRGGYNPATSPGLQPTGRPTRHTRPGEDQGVRDPGG